MLCISDKQSQRDVCQTKYEHQNYLSFLPVGTSSNIPSNYTRIGTIHVSQMSKFHDPFKFLIVDPFNIMGFFSLGGLNFIHKSNVGLMVDKT
ncbi:hypothetical protein AQUCO_06100045v1 [Aquilegia coerulea]|uniref:Uncharacterized protein n=1 Tax=Aquilegia coerulea TaxID=218851 RepID=A0A2G5CEJ0_AQUCA|nr:hypothetical protein AQUCO_06100045v1 [Aquilegia coerulea]